MAGPADRAATLLREYAKTTQPALKAAYVEILDVLWPGIRCSYDPEHGLRIHYRSDHASFQHLPRSLLAHADYVEEVSPSGKALVRVNKRGREGPIAKPTRKMSDLNGVLPRLDPSIWDILLDDED